MSRNADRGSWPPQTSAEHPPGSQSRAPEEEGPSVFCQANSLGLLLTWPGDPPSQVGHSANQPAL